MIFMYFIQMAVEIKQTLEREFEIFLTPQDLRSLT